MKKITLSIFTTLLLPLSFSYGVTPNHPAVKNHHRFNLLAPQQVVGNWQVSHANANSEITMHTFKMSGEKVNNSNIIFSIIGGSMFTGGTALFGWGYMNLKHGNYYNKKLLGTEEGEEIFEQCAVNKKSILSDMSDKFFLKGSTTMFTGILIGTIGLVGFIPSFYGLISKHQSKSSINDPSQASIITFKNSLNNDLYYDAQHSRCSNGSKIIQGFDILAGKNNQQGVPQAIAGQSYSIGAVIYADKKRKAAHCTLAYSTNEQASGKAYHRTLRLKVDQIAMGSNGQLQATVIPADGISGKALYIQPPKAVAELQRAEFMVKSLAKPAIPFVKHKDKQADNSQSDATDQAKPGVAIVGLSSGDDNNNTSNSLSLE